MTSFANINNAFNQVFQPNRLSIGLVVPIENYANSSIPTMQDHVARVQLAEQLGFAAVWVRDVPFNVPNFGDVGQTFDPMTYLGFLAAHTQTIGLGVASIALPLHHPVHVAKAAASIECFSNGRMLLGIASGDRAEEYPAMGIDYDQRGARFREAVDYLRHAQQDFPQLKTQHYGSLNGALDILPKPTKGTIPLLVTGGSRQSPQWTAEHGDGWISYPRPISAQKETVANWRALVAEKSNHDKPFMQPLYIDLQADDDFAPQAIHLGIRTGMKALLHYCKQLEHIGVNHVALNLRFNTAAIDTTLAQLADKLLFHFHSNKDTA